MLFVWMLMCNGFDFCVSKFVYDEVGCLFDVVVLFVVFGWVDLVLVFMFDELFVLLIKVDLLCIFLLFVVYVGECKFDWFDWLWFVYDVV